MATVKEQTPIYYEVRREGNWKIPNIKLPEPGLRLNKIAYEMPVWFNPDPEGEY